MALLGRAFFDRPAELVARELLGQALVRRAGGRRWALIITETEAYLGPHDLACHSARGRTPSTEAMFGPPGTLYIYLIHGLHLLLNVVAAPEGYGAAVLIRSAGPAHGPGRLGRLLALSPALTGRPASPTTGLWFEERERRPQPTIATARIGVDYPGPRWSRRKLRFLFQN